ncbi:RNA polymerase sigma factor [Imtechella halotolerans]|uniref:ECF subfamily RNA polymerase sigma-24 subunit n=1 Tax=Imtechella halotolerans K1 TaxID=946077 RepID=I0WE52_9FLAO|nr:RNA polymerase sigma factor [Imtechella halotolerans]EID74668.1 ECF subfamily RNA polymerase sigma-24 subunit [Imtechella halotolerans K1]WMQ64211.1 RNA polymerase sigma factor [Imtechella halotolerans]
MACKNGQQRAQATVYDMYYKAMYNTAYRIVKDAMEAEDVMQEAFLKAFSKLDSYRGEVAFGAWLKKIVVNHSIGRYRMLMAQSTNPLEEVLYKVEAIDDTDDEANDYTNMKAQKVLEIMATLPDNYRIALTLHLVEGYDYDELCEILEVSPGNCRTTISRAKESLRNKMKLIWN